MVKFRMARHWILQSLAASAAVLFALSAQAEVKITRSNSQVKIEAKDLNLNQRQSVNDAGQSFVSLEIGGQRGHSGILYRVGHPEVPVLRFVTTSRPKISFHKSQFDSISLDTLVKPVQPPLIKDGSKAKFAFDSAAYQANRFYPGRFMDIQEAGSVRGQKQYLVSIYPTQYNAASGKVRFYNSFEISFSDAKTKLRGGKDAIAFVVGERFVNSAALRSFTSQKQSAGFEVIQVNIGNNVRNSDDIRRELQSIYRNPQYNLMHVLLIGDAEDVPGHNSTLISGMTDHYYRAIDTDDYATDINGPDIGSGRISATNETELAAILAKSSRYEVGSFSETGWLDQVAFIATDDNYEVAESSHNYAIQTYTTAHGYTGIFPQAVQAGGDQLYAISHQVEDSKVHEAMQQGRTIINYSGHGSTDSWAGPSVTQADVRNLSDPNALPFVISNACITGDYRVSESFAETWQRHPAGSIVFWGSMDSTYWTEDDILERAMYDAIYRDGKLNFSTLTDAGLRAVWIHYGGEAKSAYYWETYVLFGDSSLNLRTSQPDRLQVEGMSAIPLGMTQVSWRILNQAGQPVKSARVNFRTASISRTVVSDERGVAAFDFDASELSPSQAVLSIVAANAAQHSQNVQIIAADQAFISLNQLSTNGRSGSEAYAGELLRLTPTLKNLGLKATSGGRLVIQEVSGPIDLVQNSGQFGATAANASTGVTGNFAVKVRDDATAFAPARILWKWETIEGETGNFSTNLNLMRGQLEAIEVRVAETGNGEGIAVGETGEIEVVIKNTGNEVMRNLVLSPNRTSTCLESIDDISVSEILPGETKRVTGTLSVSLSASCRNGETAQAEYSGTYQGTVAEVPTQLRLGFTAGRLTVASQSATVGLEIPDSGPAQESILRLEGQANLADIGVTVHITHPYIGDLTVRIVHPDGTEVLLHERTGGSDDNINKTYGMGGEAIQALSALKGKSAAGDWKLVVRDHAGTDAGIFDSWSLDIKAYW
jgi:subtilisin-like proprotein convertase family protein